MNILLSSNGTVTEYFNIFEYYVNKFKDTEMTTGVWLQFTIVITLAFIVRGYLLIRFEKQKINENESSDKLLKNIYIYCGGHVAYEWVMGYIISYFVIKLSGSNSKLFSVNIFLGPAIGFLLAMLFDNKIIMKLEDSNNIANMKKPTSNDHTNQQTSHNKENRNIVINVNDVKEQKENSYDIRKIDNKEIDNESLSKTIDTINNIIDKQSMQNDEIESIKNQINDINDIIYKLKQIEMNDKKIEIKNIIYRCLNKGFATPQENDEVTLKYNSYISLNGNHEVEALYKNHYLLLQVHEDRRKSNIIGDRRSNVPRIPYGTYDDEIIVKEEHPLE